MVTISVTGAPPGSVKPVGVPPPPPPGGVVPPVPPGEAMSEPPPPQLATPNASASISPRHVLLEAIWFPQHANEKTFAGDSHPSPTRGLG
ncbi:MAG: hypothetical protein GC206_10960 [Alphaproteobacteria bacterium]|nr:hypothetical protein [Alphaproteobacteria bacterium]